MALILEVLQPGRHAEVRERHRLGDAPVTIGRGLDNAVVLDDPHVDVRHARLEPQDDGSWALVDLGSVNGIGLGRAAPAGGRVVVADGLAVTLGRTTLRFRDEAAPLPPALPIHAAAGPSWIASPSARLGVIGLALAVGILDSWLGMTTRGAASQVFAQAIAMAVFVIIWAGVWSIAARVVLGRFNFLTHAAIAAAAVAVITVIGDVFEWARFLLPAFGAAAHGETAAMLAVMGAVVATHLAAASHLAPRLRWRAGAVAAGIVLALIVISSALEEESFFMGGLEYSGEIKTVTPALVPLQSAEEFARTRAELRAEVDALLEDR